MRAPGEGKNTTLRLVSDTSGVAAVEMAILLPVMLVMLLGMVEAFSLVQAYGKMVSATQTVADLTSRGRSQTTASMDAIVTAAQRVMDPLPSGTAQLGVQVASVGFGSDGVPRVLWTYGWGAAATQPPLSITQGLGAAGESVVLVSVSYRHAPLIDDVLGDVTMQEWAVSRPRLVRLLPYNGSTGTLP